MSGRLISFPHSPLQIQYKNQGLTFQSTSRQREGAQTDITGKAHSHLIEDCHLHRMWQQLGGRLAIGQNWIKTAKSGRNSERVLSLFHTHATFQNRGREASGRGSRWTNKAMHWTAPLPTMTSALITSLRHKDINPSVSGHMKPVQVFCFLLHGSVTY